MRHQQQLPTPPDRPLSPVDVPEQKARYENNGKAFQRLEDALRGKTPGMRVPPFAFSRESEEFVNDRSVSTKYSVTGFYRRIEVEYSRPIRKRRQAVIDEAYEKEMVRVRGIVAESYPDVDMVGAKSLYDVNARVIVDARRRGYRGWL